MSGRGARSRAVLVATSALSLVGCEMPGPRTAPEAIAALERADYVAGLAVGPRSIGALRGGPEGLPRVVLVHGTPGDAEGWADYVAEPLAGFEVWAIDRPGFGRSARGGAELSLAEQARAIEPLLEVRGGRWPVVVGHSLGGAIAARLAADYPDRVGALVILAGSLDPALEEPKWYNDVLDWGLVRWAVPMVLRTSNAEIFAARSENEMLAGVLGRVRCPVVIVHGKRDGLVPVQNVDYTVRMLTGSRAVEVWRLADEGHLLPWKREAEVRRAIERAAALQAGAGGGG